MKPEIEKERDKELEILIKELQKADDTIYAVLISHLYIDHLLDRYLIASTTNDVGLTGNSGDWHEPSARRFIEEVKLHTQWVRSPIWS